MLQVLLLAVLSGVVVSRLGTPRASLGGRAGERAVGAVRDRGNFDALSPLGAFGAMAFTVGKYGLGSPEQLGQADGSVLRHFSVVRVCRARPHAALPGSVPGAPARLPTRRAGGRARHLVFRVGAAALDGQTRSGRLRAPGRALGRSRGAIRSISTAPRSTSPWPACSWHKR